MLLVDDLVDAYETFIDRASGLKASVLNMGGGPRFTLSLLELLAILEKGLQRKIHVSYGDWRPADPRVYISGIQKAREQLGWEPQVGPDVGVGRILAWIRSQSFAKK